jgi:hypothetical protein
MTTTASPATFAYGTTVRVATLLTLPKFAVMVVLPVVMLVARPLTLIAATLVFEEFHVTRLVTLGEVPSLK